MANADKEGRSVPEAELIPCPNCRGQGWTDETVAVHAWDCDGSCIGCPVPERVQEQCGTCGGSGRVEASVSV